MTAASVHREGRSRRSAGPPGYGAGRRVRSRFRSTGGGGHGLENLDGKGQQEPLGEVDLRGARVWAAVEWGNLALTDFRQ